MLSFLHSPDHTIRQWSEPVVQQWLCHIGMEQLKHTFLKFNGAALLNLDSDSISKLTLNELYHSKFCQQLLHLRKIQRRYDKALYKFTKKSKIVLTICESIIQQKDKYNWLLYFINTLSPTISSIFKQLVPHIPSNKFDKFHYKLTTLMNEILPIITYHFKTKDILTGKTQTLLYFVLNTVSWCYNSFKYDNSKVSCVITKECWLKSKLLQEILNKFSDAVCIKPDYIISCGLLMIIASLAAFTTLDNDFKNLFNQIDVSVVLNSFIRRYCYGLNDIQISFPFRTILYLNGSKNEEIEWIINNTNAIDAILNEFKCGLNNKCVNDMFNYYPDAWDRAIAINILCDNPKVIDLLIKKDIISYLKKGLTLQQRTNIETERLYKNICIILMKITANPENFQYFYKYFNVKRLIYYNNEKNKVFWYRLNAIRSNCVNGIDCSQIQPYTDAIFGNVYNFYYHLFKRYTLINDDLIEGSHAAPIRTPA
eukprot:281979_1